MRRLLHIFIIILCLGAYAGAQSAADRYISKSALESGKWIKIEIKETGIYKLTYADLRKMGFENPENVSVHGYGGWPLDEDFSAGSAQPYIDDLPAVSVWKGNDYLLFYGRGPIKWEYSFTYRRFIHTNNPYSLYGYYFLTESSTPRVMDTEPNTAHTASARITSFDDYRVYEQDLVSLNTSGRELYGESLRGVSSALNISFPTIPGITNEPGKVTMRFVARPVSSGGTATLQWDGDDEPLSLNIPVISENNSSYIKGNVRETTASWNADKKENVTMKLSYSNTSHENIHLDYIRLQMKRELKVYNQPTFFRSITSRGLVSRFIIQGANAHTRVFDVTDPVSPKLIETELNGSEMEFTIPASAVLREFVLVQTDGQGFMSPNKTEEVDTQNLHELSAIDMIVIAPSFLKEQAERLAEEHRQRDGLSVEVVTAQEVYNEFSSGTPDASAYRRLMKMLYDRATTEKEKPRYLLLFGDGVYDNRAATTEVDRTFSRETIHQRLLLTYQSANSLDLESYVTDDYFALLDDNIKITASTPIEKWDLNIGVGRMPLRTVSEARQAVDKIIGYMDNKEPGAWKNKLCFVGDDGNNADSFSTYHGKGASEVGDIIEAANPEYQVNKVIFDSFKKDFSGQTSYPGVRERIQQLFKNGLFMINYSGHGDTQSWSDEKVLTLTDIMQASYEHLPLWVTATCDFTRFDALTTSAGEQVFLNRTSGGIALYTTTRAVFREKNRDLNLALAGHLFARSETGERKTLGEIMRDTKNDLSDANKLNFILIGDPALRLAYPDHKVKVTAINGQPVSKATQNLRALEWVTVEGEVVDYADNKASDFNGTIYPTIMDSRQTVTTLGNSNSDSVFSYDDYPNMIYSGNDVVKDGKFSFRFMVPKDISYSNDFGKMNFYAVSESGAIEAQGSFKDFRVGGSNPNPEVDNEGPEIRQIYLNDTTFVDGGKVNTTPLFVARLWDQSGVNISGSSVGHDLMLIIDGKSALSYNLNSYYENIPEREGEGLVVFSIPALSEGTHTAVFMAWDIYNNPSRDTIRFEVAKGIKPALIDVYATPNPAREQVEFRLVHNRPESSMAVNLLVYDMQGRLLWEHEERGSSELFKSYVVSWDLTNSQGTRLRPGVYLYRAAISTDHSKEATRANKLIILAQ